MKVLFPCEKRSGGFYSSSSSTRDISRAIVGSDQWFERASIARRSTNDTNRKDAVFVRVGYGGAHSGTYIGMAHLCETLAVLRFRFPTRHPLFLKRFAFKKAIAVQAAMPAPFVFRTHQLAELAGEPMRP